MVVVERKIFPASKDEVFNMLKTFKILKAIASPHMSFEPVNTSEKLIWKEGETFTFRAKLLGLIPFGFHEINVIDFDKDYRIYTNEINTYVPVWNHEILLNDLGDGRTEYFDIVEIYAGWKTVFIYIWAKMFYKHRQRKWVRILRARNKRRYERLR